MNFYGHYLHTTNHIHVDIDKSVHVCFLCVPIFPNLQVKSRICLLLSFPHTQNETTTFEQSNVSNFK